MPEVLPFTPLGEPDLETRILNDVSQVTAAVKEELGDTLEALLLGGGYGRGEGGGIKDNHGLWKPYNDYDLLAVVRGTSRFQSRRVRQRLLHLGTRLEKRLGIEVEISPLRKEELPKLPFTMMWCELFGEHRLLFGEPRLLQGVPVMPPHSLPLIEGVRYLTNRGALLLWALSETLPHERTWKFVHKVWLAIGAAVLIGNHQFEIGYTRRQAALEKLPDAQNPVPECVQHHLVSVNARLRPEEPPDSRQVREELDEACFSLLTVWKWLEEHRMGRPFPSWEEYSKADHLFAEPVSRMPGLAARHLFLSGPRGLYPVRFLSEHPRTRVTRVLPQLLLSRDSSESAARLLGSGPAWDDRARACLALWRRAN